VINVVQIVGGGNKVLRLCFIWLVFNLSLIAFPGEPAYKGAINYIDWLPNQFFTLDADGNIALGNSFNQATGLLSIDPTGNILLGNNTYFLPTGIHKWYRIEGDSFVESPYNLPASFTSPVVWTSVPYRCIVSTLPIRVWQLNPVTLQATMLSEYMDSEAIGDFATFVPELGYIYYSEFFNTIRRMQYDEATGIISGPVTIFPTPPGRLGGLYTTQTSDGRFIIRLNAGYLTIFHVEDDGSLTVTQDHELYLEFGIANPYRAAVSPDDRFLFIISLDLNNVNSFDLSTSGTITAITRLSGFDLAQALAVTPDGRFLVVAHHYYGGYPAAILSVFEVGEDGSLTYLSGKDVPLSNTVAELAFFPPPTELSTAAKNWTLYW